MKTISFRFAASIITAVAAAALVATGIAACSRSGESPDASEADLSGAAVGQIRGVVAISDTLRTRMLDDTDPRSPKFAVERLAGPGIFGLRTQLGVFSQAGTQTAFQGGTPTPFNMALWHQLFARFGDSMGDLCASNGPDVIFTAYTTQGTFQVGPADAGPPVGSFRLFPTVAQKITDVCTFQGDEAARRGTASALFDAVMGRGGSLADEKATFLTTFAADGSPFVTATPKERVSSMFVAMLLNPHFLLSN
jgi:hypothetical protein